MVNLNPETLGPTKAQYTKHAPIKFHLKQTKKKKLLSKSNLSRKIDSTRKGCNQPTNLLSPLLELISLKLSERYFHQTTNSPVQTITIWY